MLKFIERRITLQLFVFYSLFVIPLLLGGIELYLFQLDALQQSAQQTDSTFTQAIALDVESDLHVITAQDLALARSEAASQLNLRQLASIFATDHLSHPDIGLYFVCNPSGQMLLQYPSSQSEFSQYCHTSDYLQEALKSDQVAISPEQKSVTTNTHVVAIASRITDANHHILGVMVIYWSLDQLATHLMVVRQQFTNNNEGSIWVVDENGQPLATTAGNSLKSNLLNTLPGLNNALKGKLGNQVAHEQNHDWFYSYVQVAGTHWAVVIQHPKEIIFATVISFQNSLIVALFMLTLGASCFWFAMHGWVVAPLSRLAEAVPRIKPDQTVRVTDEEIFVRERQRVDEIGQLIAAFSTMEDEIHTLFRKSDEKSQARLHTLDVIMRSMAEGVLLERPDGQTVYVNQSFCQMVGISPPDGILDLDSFTDSHLSEKLLELIEDPESYQKAICRAEDGEKSQVVEFQLRGYYNQVGQLVLARRDIRVRLFSVCDLTGQTIGRGKVFHDVTRYNEAERVKKNLLAIVSHELRTPLTAIKGYASSLLEDDVELDDILQKDFLRRIVGESDRMALLITSLLEMSQLEAGTLKLYPGFHSLNSLLEAVVLADERDHIRVDLSDELPLLFVDRRRIEIVLRNLLENARRYAGADALIEISARCELDQTASAPGLYLSVADNGAGIPSHLTERIFDHFYQVDSGRERGSSGVGLGLAICRGFVGAHGGRIWAENRSQGGTGAIFHIWLPAKLLRKRDSSLDMFQINSAP